MFVLRAHGIGDAVAWGFYMRVPLRCQNCELATPRGEKLPTHTTIRSDDDGISAPIRKCTPHAASELPPPPSNDTFLPIDPPNVLSTLIKQEGAREDTTKSSNRPDIKIRPDDGPRQINALPLPPCFACIRERQQRNKTLMFR